MLFRIKQIPTPFSASLPQAKVYFHSFNNCQKISPSMTTGTAYSNQRLFCASLKCPGYLDLSSQLYQELHMQKQLQNKRIIKKVPSLEIIDFVVQAHWSETRNGSWKILRELLISWIPLSHSESFEVLLLVGAVTTEEGILFDRIFLFRS